MKKIIYYKIKIKNQKNKNNHQNNYNKIIKIINRIFNNNKKIKKLIINRKKNKLIKQIF